MALAQKVCNVDLYPYEYEFGWRIVYSMLSEDADEITALFSRQSGKTETVAVVVVGAMVILPLLAQAIPTDPRIRKFENGVWCGIYAPGYEQAAIMWNRMKLRLYSKESKSMLLDPDINLDLTNVYENMTLPNGSFCDCGTAAPQANIEGKTYHLILLEECQDISSSKIRASIHPMAAATAGSIVKIGTPNRNKTDFYESCRRNQRRDLNLGRQRSRHRNHFQFDYTVAQRYNPRYRKYVEKEKERLGEDSDDFMMKYKLHWLLERGMFCTADMLDECAIKHVGSSLFGEQRKGRGVRRLEFVRPLNVVTYDRHTPDLVFSIDVGRENSTIVTVGKVFWEGPQQFGDETRYPIHIYNWLELHGDDHEAQHPQIIDFLKNYRVTSGIIDATGKGDPVYSRLAADLDKFGITVTPFVFSDQSKDLGYKVLLQELQTRRITYPAGPSVTRLAKYMRFYNQMVDLEKSWRGQKMMVSKPKGDKEARDDYPDSLMLLSYLVNVGSLRDVEVAPNPFVGSLAELAAQAIVRESRAWYGGVAQKLARATRPLQPVRPNKRGKW